MSKRASFATFAFWTFLLIQSFSFAQEKLRLVRLSPELRDTISLADRNRFRLFYGVRNFLKAVVLESDSGIFLVKFFTRDNQGTVSDTTIAYPLSLLLNIAERVNHYEEIENGTYTMGSDPARLKVGGEYIDRSSMPGEDKSSVSQAATVTRDSSSSGRSGSDLFPFAHDGGLSTQRPASGFGVGFGISTYWANFTGIPEVFTAVEDTYRKQGVNIPVDNSVPRSPVLLWVSADVTISEAVTLSFEGLTGAFGDVDCKGASFGGKYNFRIRNVDWAVPFVGLSIGNYYYKATRDENVTVSGGGSSYTTLDNLVSEGSNFGLCFQCGAHLFDLPGAMFDISAAYLYVPKFDLNTQYGSFVPVNLSSFIVRGMWHFSL